MFYLAFCLFIILVCQHIAVYMAKTRLYQDIILNSVYTKCTDQIIIAVFHDRQPSRILLLLAE